MKIIINADDFGRSISRNEAVAESIRHGFCTQATIMVNMEHTEHAADLAHKEGFSDRVGLHINVTAGRPLTAALCANELYCKDSCLICSAPHEKIRKIGLGNILCLRTELRAQIEKYFSLGFTLRHIDSHNWMHLNLPAWLALAPLLKEYGFITMRPIRPGLLKEGSFERRLYFKAFKLMQSCYSVSRVKYSSSIEQFLENETKTTQKFEYAELFMHPDYVNGELIDTTYSYSGSPQVSVSDNFNKVKSYERISYLDLHRQWKKEGRQ